MRINVIVTFARDEQVPQGDLDALLESVELAFIEPKLSGNKIYVDSDTGMIKRLTFEVES